MNKIASFLGIVRKAGKLSFGSNSVKQSVLKGKSKLVVLTCDVSYRSFSKFEKLSQEHNVDILVIKQSMDDLKMMFGKKVGIFSVNDESFAKNIIKLEGIAYDKKVSST